MLVDTGSSSNILYLVVDIEDPSYNGLIGRPILTALRAIVSPIHLKMKFPNPGGIGEVCGDEKRARICYQTSVPPINRGKKELGYKQGRKNHMEVNVMRGREEEDNAAKERESEKCLCMGPEDMPGIDPEITIHRLYVDSKSLPIKQKKRNFSDEKNAMIREEIQVLLKAKAIG
ncbi:hypothetical protein LIER_17684 [Lithospermum erythrorhizon]|uniref:Uncharacterized protein n=1 Tax=Lithospermum erythrorhizon TaxID=34254 RepID=A0AAV3QCK2_LITER